MSSWGWLTKDSTVTQKQIPCPLHKANMTSVAAYFASWLKADIVRPS